MDEEIQILNKKIGLSEKHQSIIDYHYGLDGSGKKTLQATGDKFGITRERVRQIKVKYLEKVKKEYNRIKNFNRYKRTFSTKHSNKNDVI